MFHTALTRLREFSISAHACTVPITVVAKKKLTTQYNTVDTLFHLCKSYHSNSTSKQQTKRTSNPTRYTKPEQQQTTMETLTILFSLLSLLSSTAFIIATPIRCSVNLPQESVMTRSRHHTITNSKIYDLPSSSVFLLTGTREASQPSELPHSMP